MGHRRCRLPPESLTRAYEVPFFSILLGVEFIDRYNLSTFIGYDLRINAQLLEHNISGSVRYHF